MPWQRSSLLAVIFLRRCKARPFYHQGNSRQFSVFTPDQYQLVDFGNQRKLERFGRVLLDRPCPAALAALSNPAQWSSPSARYQRQAGESGRWETAADLPDRWQVAHDRITLELSPTPFGHLGIFPEQAACWDWIGQQTELATPPLKILNLFAYTGGSTLSAAAAGAEVVHVDAAANIVGWARRNAELSGLSEKPIRWIAEDALKFVHREVRRQNRYNAVILDPPSFGRGPKGEVWKATEHLESLLAACAELTSGNAEFVLVTCHTPEIDVATLRQLVRTAFANDQLEFEAESLTIRSTTGRELPSGVMCRGRSSRDRRG